MFKFSKRSKDKVSMVKKFIQKVSDSMRGKDGEVSHTKISSYVILASIVVSSIVFLAIDVANAIVAWEAGNDYEIPIAHITIFGMILGHHLFLLGIKKASENRQTKYDTQAKVAKIQSEPTHIPPKSMDIDIDMDMMDGEEG